MHKSFPMRMRVGICEDNAFTRSTLESALRFEDVDVVFSAASAAEAQAASLEHKPHAMLIDLLLGVGPNGLELARQLRKTQVTLGIVFLSSLESPRLLDRSPFGLPSRAQYLTKDGVLSVTDIISALQRSIGPTARTSEPIGSLSQLTDLQLDVLELVAEGQTNGEIAQRLGISIKSVEALIRRIVNRLEIQGPVSSNQRVHIAKVYLRAFGGSQKTYVEPD